VSFVLGQVRREGGGGGLGILVARLREASVGVGVKVRLLGFRMSAMGRGCVGFWSC
jgi:hypothetical protein